MASVIKAGVVASAYVLGRGRHVLVCASRRADINVSILCFVCIDAEKALQASVRALGGSGRDDQEGFFACMIVPPADRLGFGLEIRLTL